MIHIHISVADDLLSLQIDCDSICREEWMIHFAFFLAQSQEWNHGLGKCDGGRCSSVFGECTGGLVGTSGLWV